VWKEGLGNRAACTRDARVRAEFKTIARRDPLGEATGIPGAGAYRGSKTMFARLTALALQREPQKVLGGTADKRRGGM
jgi:hypothetical protein